MKEIIKLGISLFIFCAIAALALAFTNELTKNTIAEQRAAKELEAKKEVFPDAEDFESLSPEELVALQEIDSTIADVSIAVKGGETIGYVVKTLPNGFGGPIVVITGMDAEGIISGVRIGNNTESPGLGSKAAEEPFYGQYAGKSAEEVKVTKGIPGEQDIVAIASSTITSNAVTSGVHSAFLAIQNLGQ